MSDYESLLRRVEELEAENDRLRRDIKALEQETYELENELYNYKDMAGI